MALGTRKSSDIFNKNTGAADSKTIDTATETDIQAKFDNGNHIQDAGMFENLAPVLYAIQQLTEDIEELRRYATAELTDAAQLDASTLPTSPPSTRGLLWSDRGVVRVS